MQTAIVSGWLLALGGLFQAAFALANFFMAGEDGFLNLQRLMPRTNAREMGTLALVAGICTIAGSLARSRPGRSSMLTLNGLAFSAFGLLSLEWPPARTLSFRPVSLLFVAMALSLAADGWRRRGEDWFPGVTAVAGAGSALLFLALGFHWIRFVRPYSFFLWMTFYFSFSAACLLAAALRRRPAPGMPVPWPHRA